MARKLNTTPESGYKFKCQSCEDDVYQVNPPKLVMNLVETGSGKNKGLQTEPLQCCTECATEIEKEVAKIQKKHKLTEKQTTALRPSLAQEQAELAAKANPAPASTEAKLDKLIELMTLMLSQQQVLQPPAPVNPLEPLELPNAPSKTPKRTRKPARNSRKAG